MVAQERRERGREPFPSFLSLNYGDLNERHGFLGPISAIIPSPQITSLLHFFPPSLREKHLPTHSGRQSALKWKKKTSLVEQSGWREERKRKRRNDKILPIHSRPGPPPSLAAREWAWCTIFLADVEERLGGNSSSSSSHFSAPKLLKPPPAPSSPPLKRQKTRRNHTRLPRLLITPKREEKIK